MGVNMEFSFDKYCKVGHSPNTVLPLPQKNKNQKQKLLSRCENEYELLSSEEGFTEINFCKHRNPQKNKNRPSGDLEIECNEVSRQGSVYRRPEIGSGRKKIEFSFDTETSFSFGILDSICGLDEENEARFVSLRSRSVDLRDRRTGNAESSEMIVTRSRKYQCDQVSGPCTDANVLNEENFHVLNKSLSAKLSFPHSPAPSDRDGLKETPKSRFIPIKKMFDPLTKSRSHRNEVYDHTSSGLAGFERSRTLRKSLLHDFSSVGSHTQQRQATLHDSPAHLKGIVSMEHKHGCPFFEFSVLHSDDVLVAKRWKDENALSWVYTFHSFHGRKRGKDSPVVAQMQVSCYLSSEIRGGGGGDFTNSMVTEFVLYDLAHARKGVPTEDTNFPEISKIAPDSRGNVELDDLFDLTKHRPIPSLGRDIPTLDPLPSADLHPGLEIAAIVVQCPLEKRESLKHRRGDKVGPHFHSCVSNDDGLTKVNVVTPLGHHGSPTSGESRGPSPLLDRWRLGGGCDCGGWDMACPLIVFGNHDCNKCVQERFLLENDRPLKLYREGSKRDTAAVTITTGDRGQYTVDFHAHLSTLQAFAVCVAILHTTDTSASSELERSKQLLQCSSVKVLVDDEVKLLIEAVTEDEKKNKKTIKTTDENPTPFSFKPPISPIARV